MEYGIGGEMAVGGGIGGVMLCSPRALPGEEPSAGVAELAEDVGAEDEGNGGRSINGWWDVPRDDLPLTALSDR